MATDLLAMRTEMQEHGFSDTSTARLNALINDSYYDVCSRYTWPFLEAEVDAPVAQGSATPTNPSDLRAVLSLVNDDASTGGVLTPERYDVLVKKFAGSLTTQGQPIWYYFLGDTLKVFPVSDASYTLKLKYLKFPTALSNDTDLPLIPERHRRVIVLGALADAYRMEDDPELGQVFENQFEKRVMSMVEDLLRKQFDRPERVYDLFQGDEWS